MSINAVNGVSQASLPVQVSAGITAAPAATSFDQELDARGVKTGLSHGLHHHHAGAPQSVTTSATTAASAAGAGAAPLSTIAAALQHLLS